MTRLRALRFGAASPSASRLGARGLRASSFGIFLLYLLLATVMTWPLAAGLARDVPGDLGDSLLNMWILGWGAEHVPRLLIGDASLRDYWNANIFHPEPLALGFSEHLFGLVIQILPVYWTTGNLILCYNLLFLSSYALSGLGMFLLVRDLLSADPRATPRAAMLAAFVAGVIFAFTPFRIAQVAHIQSLHAQWMPLALFGLRRFVTTGRHAALWGGSAALVMQNWSNGYYLLYFAPFVPAFVVHQMWTAGRLRDVRMWAALIGAALVVTLATVPLLWLYVETQRVHAFERPIGEIIGFSADVYSYLTAPEALRVWGDVMRAWPKPEGELFLGVLPWVLLLVALFSGVARGAPTTRSRLVHVAVVALVAIIVVEAIGVLVIIFTGGFITSVAGIPVRATNASRLIVTILVASVILLTISSAARQRAHALARSPMVLCVAFTIVAMWLSLGPVPQSRGGVLPGLGLYSVLYEHLPGFDGLRVPARYVMIAAVFLSVVAGYGAVTLMRRHTLAVAAILTAAFLTEAWFAPMPINLTWGSSMRDAPPRVFPSTDAPPVYHTVANLRDDAVVAEFPFGDTTWELRYVYYSTVHWKRLVNGYSGGFPQGYRRRVALLQRVRDNPDAAWRALRDAGTTHVIVHEQAYPPGEADVVTRWLTDHFAVEIAHFEGDRLFDVSGVWPPQ